jgi:hypothetical protein
MPSSPLLAHSGLAVIGSIVFLALFAGVLTTLVSIVLLAAYRARVGRLMSFESTAPAVAPAHADAAKHAARPVERDNQTASASEPNPKRTSAEALYRVTQAGPLRLAGRYALAGAAFALIVGTAAYFAFSQAEINYLRAAAHPLQLALLVWIAAWPIVLTIAVVVTSSRMRWAAVAGYFSIFGLIGAMLIAVETEAPLTLGEVILPGWSGESPLRLAAKWSAFNAAPTLLIVLFRHRRLRAVAPLVLAFTTVIGAGLLAAIASAFAYRELSVRIIVAVSELLAIEVRSATYLYLAICALAACLACAILGWLVLAWIRRRHERKALSDQSLAISSQAMVFAAFYAGILAYGGPHGHSPLSPASPPLTSHFTRPRRRPTSVRRLLCWFCACSRSASRASGCSMPSPARGGTQAA